MRIRPIRLLSVLVVFLSLAGLGMPAAANEKYAAIVYDANTGETLFARHADAKRYPASLTKMMTLYVLFEDLEARRFSLSSRLSVSANASRQAPSKLGLRAGTSIKVEDAILALTTKSANDVAVVVAEAVSGSVSDFAARMNRTARALGMKNTNFRNPHGLPDSRQVTTARDMAQLGRALQDRFPTYYKYFSARSFTYRGNRYRNHNRLLGAVRGVDGIKTGYTRASGFNLVTNVERDGRHIIAVVMGGRTGASRNAHMRELIDKYLPRASRSGTLAPLIVDTGSGGPILARLPRARPVTTEEAGVLLGYAATEPTHDVVSEAMAEAAAMEDFAQGDINDVVDEESDPIASRISTASAVAELATPSGYAETDSAAIARLSELARIRAGDQELIASAPAPGTQAPRPESAWYVQIGAVPTEAGALALIEKAQQSLGPVLASLQPVTQEIEHRGETLYRARFAGFDDKDEARATCHKLESKSFACLAVPN